MRDKPRFSWLAALLLGVVAACSSPPSGPASADAAVAIAERLKTGVELRRRGRSDEALAVFDAIVAAHPLHVAAHRERQNLRAGRLEAEALHREYAALAAAHPRSAAAHYLFGRLRFRDADRLSSFRRARDLDPRFAWAHHAEAHVLVRQGELPRAEASVRRALALDPANPSVRVLLADLLLRREQNLDAVGVLEAGLEEAPESLLLRSSLVEAYLAAGQTLAALDMAEEVLRLEPRESAIRGRLTTLATQRVAEPAGYLAAGLLEGLGRKTKRPDPTLDLALARVRAARGDAAGAAAAADRALAAGFRPSSALTFARSLPGLPLHRSFGAWAEALDIDLGPENPRLHELASALAARDGGVGAERRLFRALAAAGWIDEALRVGSRLEKQQPEVAPELGRLRAHRRFMAELALIARERRTKNPVDTEEDLATYLGRIRTRLAERGFPLEGEERVLGFAFLGEVLDLTHRVPGTLNGYLDQFNQVLVVGRWSGEAPQLMLATLAAPPRRQRPEGWPDDFGFVEVLAENVHIAPPDNSELGRAFFRAYYVNVERVADSRRARKSLERLPAAVKTRLLAARGLEASGADERRSIAEPLDTGRTLLIRALELHPGLPLMGHVRAHEIGHVRDAAQRLPVGSNLVSNLLLAVQAGFSADRLGGILEETAQLAALRDGPSPHLALSDIVDFIPRGDVRGFHQRGYRTLLERFLAVLDERRADYPAIRGDRVLLHQLHHLSEAEIREIARAIRR